MRHDNQRRVWATNSKRRVPGLASGNTAAVGLPLLSVFVAIAVRMVLDRLRTRLVPSVGRRER